MKHLHFRYDFHAVGQGLFATGRLCETPPHQRFAWVFDCGTASRRAFLQREITRFKTGLNGNQVGLFCLSHFDEDHINGARELLSSQRVDTLVMPYFPLVERVLIAFGTPGISDDYLGFLVDPAGYMFAAAGGNLGQVIFIMGGGAPPEEGSEGLPLNPSDNPDNQRWHLHQADTKIPDQPGEEDLRGVSEPDQRRVSVKGHQKPFTVGGVWEFLFFNEHIPSTKAAELRKEVAAIIRKYRRPDGSFDGTGLLRELKPLYAQKFGASGEAKNRISLVVYSGPIEQPTTRSSDLCGAVHPVSVSSFPWFEWWCWDDPNRQQPKVSIGYFGDFPLKSETRLQDVQRHFGQRRWERFQVIQIPHHGSARSWFDGASAQFAHRVSVISSERLSKKHPTQSVLDDLSTHGVVLVNEMQSASFYGEVQFPQTIS